jgi:hypothetical protein
MQKLLHGLAGLANIALQRGRDDKWNACTPGLRYSSDRLFQQRALFFQFLHVIINHFDRCLQAVSFCSKLR